MNLRYLAKAAKYFSCGGEERSYIKVHIENFKVQMSNRPKEQQRVIQIFACILCGTKKRLTLLALLREELSRTFCIHR